MKLAVMQPYLFPYVGYFQLISAVDKFVFYDDVNFIKNGWINRNRVLTGDGVAYFTIPLRGASSFKKISDVEMQPAAKWNRKILATISQAYARAPCVDATMTILEEVLREDSCRVAELAKRSVVAVTRYLGIQTEFVWTSVQYCNSALTGESRVRDICQREGASAYYNLPGGRELYDPDSFRSAGVELYFLQTQLLPYNQHRSTFEAGLSILDVLMWNSPAEVRRMLSVNPVSAVDAN